MSKNVPIVPASPPSRVKGYDVKAEDDMTGHGWAKELVWRKVAMDDSERWWERKYHFAATDYPCGNCKTTDFMWLVPQRTGIYKACLGCGLVNGPLTVDSAELIGQPTSISPEEVYGLYKARGVKKIPKVLMRQVQRGRSRTHRRRISKGVKEV